MNIHRVYRAILSRPNTCDEVERVTGLAHQVVSARIRDLAKRGRVIWTGKTRPTRYGRPAKVWEAVCP